MSNRQEKLEIIPVVEWVLDKEERGMDWSRMQYHLDANYHRVDMTSDQYFAISSSGENRSYMDFSAYVEGLGIARHVFVRLVWTVWFDRIEDAVLFKLSLGS